MRANRYRTVLMADGSRRRIFVPVARMLKLLPQELRTEKVQKIMEDRL